MTSAQGRLVNGGEQATRAHGCQRLRLVVFVEDRALLVFSITSHLISSHPIPPYLTASHFTPTRAPIASRLAFSRLVPSILVGVLKGPNKAGNTTALPDLRHIGTRARHLQCDMDTLSLTRPP